MTPWFNQIVSGEHNQVTTVSLREEQVESVLQLIKSRDQQIALEAEVKGMEKAKSRVLRRTEIPADAKTPTRDIVVIIGEECARIISDDIATLKSIKERE